MRMIYLIGMMSLVTGSRGSSCVTLGLSMIMLQTWPRTLNFTTTVLSSCNDNPLELPLDRNLLEV